MSCTNTDHPVVHLLKSLMSIVSTSELEHDIGIFLEGHLQSLGYTVERIPIAPGSTRYNVYAYLGSTRSTRVLLTAHMDTVPPHIPLTIDGDIIRGRGSSDDLGPLAAQIVAMLGNHSGYPHLGRSATSALLHVLNDLSAASWPHSPLLGRSTFNIGTLSGGEAHNIVAPSAKALCEVRMVSDLPGVKAHIASIVAQHADVECKFVFEYPEALLEWEIDGFEAAPVAFGTDVPRLKEECCQHRVLFGPGSILAAHGPEEYVRVSELVESVGGYKRLVMHFLG